MTAGLLAKNRLLRGRPLFQRAELFFFSMVALGVLITFIRVALRVRVPFELDYMEGPVLNGAMRIVHGLSPYPPATEPPYIFLSYGPIAMSLFALSVKWFGVSFTMPRLVVVASALWCVLLIFLILRNWGATPPVALGFGLLYLTFPVVQDWLYRVRVDMVGLAFSVTGLYAFTRWRRGYLAAPFFVAAVFCKLTFVAAPLACFLQAAVRKEGVRALRVAAGCFVLGACAFLYAQRATHGWFAFHTIWLNAGHPYSFRFAIKWLYPEMQHDYFLLLPALLAAYWSRSRPELWIAPIYLATAFLISLTVGKLGSNSNYFLEWDLALCLCSGLGYYLLRANCDFRSAVAACIPAGLALFILSGVQDLRLPSRYRGCGQAYAYVRNYAGKSVLSENIGALLLAGKPLLVSDPFGWSREVVYAGWSDAGVVGLIRSRQVDLIVADADVETMKRDPLQDRWTPNVVKAIGEDYRPTEEFGCEFAAVLYEPKSPENAGAVNENESR